MFCHFFFFFNAKGAKYAKKKKSLCSLFEGGGLRALSPEFEKAIFEPLKRKISEAGSPRRFC